MMQLVTVTHKCSQREQCIFGTSRLLRTTQLVLTFIFNVS